MFLSGDAPRSKGKSLAAPNGGSGDSQHPSQLLPVFDLELCLSTF